MVATHVLISLCVAGLTAAAPQLDLPGVQRVALTAGGVNQDALVSDVVSALEPSIAAAVANALRSLTTTSISATSQKASAASAGKFAGATAAVAEVTARPEYNFEFKVADNEDQTYITQQEARDGDELTGSYSYVDPTGALVTVNYQAGPDGYTQTSATQEGFIEIRPKVVRVAPTAAAAAPLVRAAAPAPAIDQSALIAQIIAALQPQIASSVNSALSATQRVAVVAAPVASSARSGDVSSLFGDGYAVRIATPEFNIQY